MPLKLAGFSFTLRTNFSSMRVVNSSLFVSNWHRMHSTFVSDGHIAFELHCDRYPAEQLQEKPGFVLFSDRSPPRATADAFDSSLTVHSHADAERPVQQDFHCSSRTRKPVLQRFERALALLISAVQ